MSSVDERWAWHPLREVAHPGGEGLAPPTSRQVFLWVGPGFRPTKPKTHSYHHSHSSHSCLLQTVPLNWAEWLVCIAVGFGTCIVSWATRWISRNVALNGGVLSLRKADHHKTRSGSGRSRTNSGRVGSGRPMTTMHGPPHGGSALQGPSVNMNVNEGSIKNAKE